MVLHKVLDPSAKNFENRQPGSILKNAKFKISQISLKYQVSKNSRGRILRAAPILIELNELNWMNWRFYYSGPSKHLAHRTHSIKNIQFYNLKIIALIVNTCNFNC